MQATLFVREIILDKLALTPNIYLDEQINTINQTIEDSGLLAKMGRSLLKEYDISMLYSLALQLRLMVEEALQPYISLNDCLIADLSNLEDTPIIYNTLTQKVYENNKWVNKNISLQGKVLIFIKEKKNEPSRF